VTYCDGLGQRREYGFTDDLEIARDWAIKIQANPCFSKAKVKDRLK